MDIGCIPQAFSWIDSLLQKVVFPLLLGPVMSTTFTDLSDS